MAINNELAFGDLWLFSEVTSTTNILVTPYLIKEIKKPWKRLQKKLETGLKFSKKFREKWTNLQIFLRKLKNFPKCKINCKYSSRN